MNFKLTRISSVISLSVLGLAVSGCSTTTASHNNYAQTQQGATKMYEQAAPEPAMSNANLRGPSFGKVSKDWVNPVPLQKDVLLAERSRLPTFFKKQVSLTMPGTVSLVEIMTELQRTNDLKITLNQDIYDGGSAGSAIGAKNSSGMGPVSVSDFVYRGTLEGALDLMASKANVSWKWNGSSVELFKFETKTYSIALQPGKTTANSQVSLQSNSDSGGGSDDSGSSGDGPTIKNGGGSDAAGKNSSSSSQGVSRSASLNSWDDVKGYITSLMSPQGSLAIMESTGLITVRDTAVSQAKIGEAVKELNNILSKQIYINVDIYSVTKDASDDYGLDLAMAWKTMNQNITSVGWSNNSGSSGTGAFSINLQQGVFAGSSATLKALSTLGKASIVNQFQIVTMNGQPTPIGNNRKIPYISGIQLQADKNGNPIQSVITGSVYQGISMSVTPKVQQNGKILLEYAMNMSDFQGFESFSTGGGSSAQSLALPKTTLKNILQRASLKSGQSLILSGFKQSASSSTQNGIGSASNFLFGGGQKAGTQEQYLVISVTPYVSPDDAQ